MTDPITCPECSGTGEDRTLPGHVLKCMCCYGLGEVGGPDDPEENPSPPPAEPPPVWEDRLWNDPHFAGINCRYCLGSRKVSHLDRAARTLVTVPCRCDG